jgi:hypothetical protein
MKRDRKIELMTIFGHSKISHAQKKNKSTRWNKQMMESLVGLNIVPLESIIGTSINKL